MILSEYTNFVGRDQAGIKNLRNMRVASDSFPCFLIMSTAGSVVKQTTLICISNASLLQRVEADFKVF